MFDRDEHREAAQVVSAVLAKHQQRFQELAMFDGNAVDQTLAILHAQAYAKLLFDLGSIAENETIRHVLNHSGILRATRTYLKSLCVVIKPRLFISPLRKPVERRSLTKNMGMASSPLQNVDMDKMAGE